MPFASILFCSIYKCNKYGVRVHAYDQSHSFVMIVCVCVYYLFRWKRTRIRFYHFFRMLFASCQFYGIFFFSLVCCFLLSVRLLLSFYLIVQCKTFALFNFFSFCNASRSRHARRLIYGRKEEKLLRLSCVGRCVSFFSALIQLGNDWDKLIHTHGMRKKNGWNENTNGGDTFFDKAHGTTANRQHLCAMHERWLTAEEWIPKD